jgi:hypothetical protein
MLLQGLAARLGPRSPRGEISKRLDRGPSEIGTVGDATPRSGAKSEIRGLP